MPGRICTSIAIIVCLSCIAVTNAQEMTPFKIVTSMRVNDQVLSFYLYFDSRYAIEFDTQNHDKLLVVYDLDSKSWTDFDPQRIVRKEDYEEWNRRTEEKTRQSLASSTDIELKKFVGATLVPRFKITRAGDTIVLANDFFTYDLSKPLALSPSQRKRFFEYDRVSAYRKAMIERKFSPSIQLAVDEELEPRNFIPGAMLMTVKTPKGNIQLNITARTMPFDAADTEPVADAIRRANAMRDSNLQKQSGNPKVPQRRTE